MKAVLNAKDGNPTNQSEMLICALEEVEKGSGDLVPVWYKIVGNECYLSHSSIGRVLQRNKWRDILGNYAPCSDPASLCPACQLFGTTEAGGFKGRISCGDAVPVYGIRQESLQFRELPILAGPRPSAFEFYLKRPVPNATYWNFDYHVVGLQDSAEYRSVPNTGIRGRKFYWHSIPDKTDARPQNDKMNTTMEILSPGEKNSFRFRLFFDRITEEQLSQLIWVVTLGENKADGRQMHKIGHGRPLGYGSVRLTVEKKTIRKFVREDNGTVNFLLQEEKLPEEVLCPWPDTGAVKAILAMTHINAASGKVVGYPMEEGKKGDVTIYNWFGKNRRSKGPDQLLPYPVVKNKNLAVSEAASLKTSLPPEEYTIDAANQRAAGKKDWSGQIVTVRIIEIKPKGAACKMPDGSKGYLKGNQQLTNKSGDRCEVRVTEFSNDFNSWQLIPVKKERVKGV